MHLHKFCKCHHVLDLCEFQKSHPTKPLILARCGCFHIRVLQTKWHLVFFLFFLTDGATGDKRVAGRSSQRGGHPLLQPLPRPEPGAPHAAAHEHTQSFRLQTLSQNGTTNSPVLYEDLYRMRLEISYLKKKKKKKSYEKTKM